MLSRILGLPIFIFLFLYGMAAFITSSEFWPVTISKTWLTPSQFETSMLQKPLLTLFLSVLHVVKMPDVLHLMIVKLIFSAICTFGLYIFVKFILKKTGHNANDTLLLNIIAGLFVLCSPTYLAYFFSIRSDQVACVLFSLFLLFCEEKKPQAAIASLALIPLFGIKEILFLIPGTIYYFQTFKFNITRKSMVYLIGFCVTALIWIVALNIPYLYYVFEAYKGTSYMQRFDTFYYKHEMYLMCASLLCCVFIFALKKQELYREATAGSLFLILLVLFPQSYYFYMASLLPFIYLPLFILLLQKNVSKHLKLGLVIFQIGFVLYGKLSKESMFFVSVFDQYRNISRASHFIGKHNLTYMDGMGILPQQKFYPCFASPFDNESKVNCLSPLKDPEVVIVTGRLAGLGQAVFDRVQQDYTQVLPNIWVLNTAMTEEIKKDADLDEKGLPLPIFIF